MVEWLKIIAAFGLILFVCALVVVGCMAELGFRWGPGVF